jgi:cell division protein FtsQ
VNLTFRRIALIALGGLALATSPWWGRRALRALTYFHVRQVRVIGTHYVAPRDIVAAMRVDTMASTWDDLRPYAARVGALAMVRHVAIDRELPATIIVRVDETTPVAITPAAGGFKVYDARARVLPIDPSRTDIDLPIIDRPDALIARLLGGVETTSPRLFARINSVSRQGSNEILVHLDKGNIRAEADVTPERLAGAGIVLGDLERRGASYVELDLRYRDQVVARLQ